MPNLVMTPATGERRVQYVGDRVRFTLTGPDGGPPPAGWRACLRTNIGRAAQVRRAVIDAVTQRRPLVEGGWRDIPMHAGENNWSVEVALTEVGFFKAKAYAVDSNGWQHWTDGHDFGLSVHPNHCRTANIIYCAFTRLFGESRTALVARDAGLEAEFKVLDKQGYTVIPPSGKLRDLARQIPHIVGNLGCRIVQLLPVNPTPTTYARMGRYGSPYACGGLTAVDPALVEFDRRTTGIQQFCELADTVHQHGGRLFLDLVINHTGWGSPLQENHPEWFLRNPDGTFTSPGAWGITWEDLVELDPEHFALWEELAEVFLTWCRRGVDGFRCDAGYKVPLPVWQYITARVREEFPAAVFLLEGLGGAWYATEALLTEGGMQWAYSELFQEYSGMQVGGYLDHALKQCRRTGVLVHYAETHDNNRLAAKGRGWSLLRNRLSALTSVNGGYGFACGVEWLAAEKIFVHQISGLAWDNPGNLVAELRQLNRLLSDHPCFFDEAELVPLSPPGSPVYALQRTSAEGKDRVLVLINTDVEQIRTLVLDAKTTPGAADWIGATLIDLLGQPAPLFKSMGAGTVEITLAPGETSCLSRSPSPGGLIGDDYRLLRGGAAWAVECLSHILQPEAIGPFDWRALGQWAITDPERFLGSLGYLNADLAREDLLSALRQASEQNKYPAVIVWEAADARRITPVPANHWLLIRDPAPFRLVLDSPGDCAIYRESTNTGAMRVACIPPRSKNVESRLLLHPFAPDRQPLKASVHFLGSDPEMGRPPLRDLAGARVLLTNGRGGMARMCVDLGRITSKYDCVLGANLHEGVPVDRHIFAKRVRVWALANGFLSALNINNLADFQAGPPGRWLFHVHVGDGQKTSLELTAEMVDHQNTTVLRFARPALPGGNSSALELKLTVRVDIEDRNFHWETKRNSGADEHFRANTRLLTNRPGFAFLPAPGRELRAYADSGQFHPQPEWCENIGHPIEQTRGQEGSGDAYSPGWFEIPVSPGESAALVITAELHDPPLPAQNQPSGVVTGNHPVDFGSVLRESLRAFVVDRGRGKTVIAGYPWFLDWGRDTLICARGLLAAGMIQEVRDILLIFGRFEINGTLPNSIHGEDASNRDTSDAPLWFGVVCEELAELETAANAGSLYDEVVDATSGRTILHVLQSIATGYLNGTSNDIRTDSESGLVWSPSHFTWMDTNHPAGTPREGYPIEIQALWIRLLRQLARLKAPGGSQSWQELADKATNSLKQLFWLENKGYFADVLLCGKSTPARNAAPDDALRSNCLIPISLGIIDGDRARKTVAAAARYLAIPGALRSLAPLPVSIPLHIPGGDGRSLNDPANPYWGHYEGDEDTRRKPAYHNGTAWTWTFPIFCEALAAAWDNSPEAVVAARSYLGSMAGLMRANCLNQLPEIVDGDAPHTPRGCDAQAWGVTEACRAWEHFTR